MSDDHKSQDEGRSEGRREGRAGGVGRDGSQKTRAPHRDVGNNTPKSLVRKLWLTDKERMEADSSFCPKTVMSY